MIRNVKHLIIGGGIVGVSVAYHLAVRGERDILIVESNSLPGLGSTGRATGGIRCQFETEINVKMSQYSLDFIKNCDFDTGYEPRGYLFFATKPEHLEYLKINTEKLRKLGVSAVEIVDKKKIGEIVPGIITDDILGGSFCQSDGFINPVALLGGMLQKAIEMGVEIECNTKAESFELFNNEIRSVTTNNGEIKCKNAVICTGARAKQLALTANIDLPVEPQRRQIVWAKTRAELPDGLPMVIDLSSGFHFRQAKEFGTIKDVKGTYDPLGSFYRPDEVLFAFPDPDEPTSFNTDPDSDFAEKVYKLARERAPFLYESDVIKEKCRAGLYENTPDHHAILGGCEVRGLYFANGFSGHGVMHSPATGRALSEIILDGSASFLDVSSLHFDRFKTGALLHETSFI